MSYRYPVLLEISDCLVAVVGGGQVALRKVAGLIDAGARSIRVISPEFHPDFPSVVDRVVACYQPGYLQGARLVFAATNSPEVNDAIISDSRRLGIWVNRADVDEDHSGDFTLPAKLSDGSLLLTVSAGGSPAIASQIRDELKDKIDPRWVRLANAMQILRPRIRASQTLTPDRRRNLLKDLASIDARDLIGQTGQPQDLWAWAQQRYPELQKS